MPTRVGLEFVSPQRSISYLTPRSSRKICGSPGETMAYFPASGSASEVEFSPSFTANAQIWGVPELALISHIIACVRWLVRRTRTMVVGYSPNVATSTTAVSPRSPRYFTLAGGLVQESTTHRTASKVVKGISPRLSALAVNTVRRGYFAARRARIICSGLMRTRAF